MHLFTGISHYEFDPSLFLSPDILFAQNLPVKTGRFCLFRKTVQGNLGHATAAFTLDVYGHVTDQMRSASAMRMQSYIQQILDADECEKV